MTHEPRAYTLWFGPGRIATFRSREKAEAYLEKLASEPREHLHIQEWVPEAHHYNYVRFDGDTINEEV